MNVEHITDLDVETDKAIRIGSSSEMRRAIKAARPSVQWLIMRDTGGTVRAGCRVALWRGWMTIEALWVDLSERGNGYGTALLERAEQSARTQMCLGLEATVYSFEASEFFLKRGFTSLARLRIDDLGMEKLWLINSFHSLPDVQEPSAGLKARRVKREARKSGSAPAQQKAQKK